MIVLRWAGPRLIGGIGAALVLVGGLVGLATGVEHGGEGPMGALLAGLSVVPITLVWLAPLCCGVGTALVMARLVAQGEDVSLAASGLGPLRTGWVAVVVGLFFGVGAWSTADRALPALVGDPASGAWLWLDGGAYRPSDGTMVRIAEGRISAIERGFEPDGRTLSRARERARPRTASASVLAQTQTPPAQVERQGRLGRIMACGAMALLGWIPWVRGSAAHVGVVLAVGLTAASLDLGLHALAAQGQLSPEIGAWAVPVLLWVCAVFSARR